MQRSLLQVDVDLQLLLYESKLAVTASLLKPNLLGKTSKHLGQVGTDQGLNYSGFQFVFGFQATK